MSVDFDAELALDAFNYSAAFSAEGEILVLFGHSGAGKSITLQLIAGLRRPGRGQISVSGRVATDTSTGLFVRPQDRGVGYVVQDLALFPHMSVAENVRFGMTPEARRSGRDRELLYQLGLSGFDDRKPRTLSGGQQQRVALARALARDAQVLLLDEPFSALDESLRRSLRRELLRLRAELGLTILFVTHDLREAHLLADRIAVFDEGSLLQIDVRETVFRRPANRRVAQLTGVANILEGTATAINANHIDVRVGSRILRCATWCGNVGEGEPVDVAIRAERVTVRRTGEHSPDEPNSVAGTLVEELAFGNSHTLGFAAPALGGTIEVELASRPYEVLGIARRREWVLELPAGDLHVMGRQIR